MQNRRLGCFSFSALLAGFVTLLVIGGAAALGGGSMFSPGDLNAQPGPLLGGVSSHADLETRCAACHAAPWSFKRMSARCLDCHTDVADQQRDPASLHGVLFANAPGMACKTCHTEHHGPNGALTDLENGRFPHEATGFSLAGHARTSQGTPFSCADCHGSTYSGFDPVICLDCHNRIDPVFTASHTTAWGFDCLACHDGLDTYGNDFDHARQPFVLTGAHLQVDCAACHQDARSRAALQSAPQDCAGCHLQDDAHQGRFGLACAVCHSTTAWKPAQFDHRLANFQLTGAHVDVACETCHVNERFQGTPTDCVACHQQDDAHQGRFGTDCAACHTTTAWKPANFDHARSAFPLTGAHVTVACEACHVSGRFQGTPTACAGCHQQDDAHQGRFGTDCAACHSTTAWKPATFDHSRSPFQLTGGHANVACESCHPNGRFQGTPTTCAGCHGDPNFHRGLFSSDCAACHTVAAWRPARFNQAHTFPVNHGGANSCRDCHTSSLNVWTCAVCHPDGQIARKHQEEGIFNFAACISCHPTGREGGGGRDD